MEIETATEPEPGEPALRTRITARRAGRQAPPGRLLCSMAVLVAGADQGKDYLDLFVPFVADALKGWPDGQPVAPVELSQALCERWGFPSVPVAVARLLLGRAQAAGYVVNIERVYYPHRDALIPVRDLAEKRTEMDASMNALIAAVILYAGQEHNLAWGEEQARAALERLSEEFGVELATAKREGQVAGAEECEHSEALAVVHAFARHAMQRDPDSFERLVAMVQGTMLMNALYFEDTRQLPRRLAELRVYIDTTPLLRALGLASPKVVTAAREMLGLLGDFHVPRYVFSHTVDEITAILDALAAALRRGTRGLEQQGQLFGARREAMDAAIQAGMTSGHIDAMAANIEQQLAELGVKRCDTPRHKEVGHIDERELERTIARHVQTQPKGAREKDVRSLAAVERLRHGGRPRELAQARAVFVTANTALSRASADFFRGAGRDAPVAHCMSDVALTGQLWVGSSRRPELPRKLLIADCYAALAPTSEQWERWVTHIVKLRREGKLTEQQVQTLIYHQQAKAHLFDLTRGEAQNIDEHTVGEVLDRYEAQIRAPVEEAARDRDELSRSERDELQRKVEDLAAWRGRREREDALRAARRWRLARRGAGIAGAALLVVLFTVLAATGSLHGRGEWATAITLLVFLAAACVSGAFKLGWKAPLAALVVAGGASALWFDVFDAAASTKAPTVTVIGGQGAAQPSDRR